MKWLAGIVVALGLAAVASYALRSKEPHPDVVSTYIGQPGDYRGDKTLLVVVKAKCASVWVATGQVLKDVDRDRCDLQVIDVDSDPDAASRLGATIIPTVFAYRDGEEVARLPNLMSADQLADALDASSQSNI